MLELDFDALSALGLTPALAGRAAQLAVEVATGEGSTRLVRIVEVHRETVVVHDGRDERVARVLPRLVRALQEEGTALACGDWALLACDVQGDPWVAARVPPASHIARKDGDGRVHTVVSNVDVALLVMGLDDDFNPRRLERFLALVHDDAIVPVVVLTKLDIARGNAALLDERMAALRERIPAHVDVHAVDATHASAADALVGYCTRGTTLALLGTSGTGKSTLTNTLLGARVQDTGAVRDHDSRGKHTTTSRSLHRLAGGACIIDTPGIRTLRPDGDGAAIAASFADIQALAGDCRFGDCKHDQEPGCAVREGVEPDRLRNYRKMLREVRRDQLTALDRQRQVQQWKVRSKAVREKMRYKRGGT
jgi:ribosome biogenesis GTPase / thiamine phosphate phosphatase